MNLNTLHAAMRAREAGNTTLAQQLVSAFFCNMPDDAHEGRLAPDDVESDPEAAP